MTVLMILICLLLLIVVTLQIGKMSELASRIKGERDAQMRANYWQSRIGMAFMILFILGVAVSALYYKNYMLGYGPHVSASVAGARIDLIFNITLAVTGIVFVITQILLFWYAYKYRGREGRKALFMPHDNRLELIWTTIPAIAMTGLVVYGLDVWGDVMADVSPDEEVINIEAMGMQFAWLLRYSGEDNEFGETNFRLIDGVNPMGMDWEDEKNHDDFMPTELVLPVGKQIRVKITSRDVLHSFDLPHFRVKMDAVPGMPTYFVFTPSLTTEEYRKNLSQYPEYRVKVDPEDPSSLEKWEVFNYELACAELCGNGHFSMRRLVRVVSEEEYEEWLDSQQSYYESSIKGSDADPFAAEHAEEAQEPHAEEGEEMQETEEQEMEGEELHEATADSVEVVEEQTEEEH